MTVRQKQHLLAYLGYYTGVVDGIWGDKSVEATKNFQRQYDLTPDGSFGPLTQEKIKAVIASPAAVEGEDWWSDIRYFTKEEFRCRCGGRHCDGFPAEPRRELVKLADQVRTHFGRPAIVSSGLRCSKHNAACGGVANSRHLSGKALDFRIQGSTAAQTLAYVLTLPVRYAYAIDGSFVHMDVE